MTKYYVSGTPSGGYNVYTEDGWGPVDSGYPAFRGTKVAEGFATAQEAFAWAKQRGEVYQ